MRGRLFFTFYYPYLSLFILPFITKHMIVSINRMCLMKHVPMPLTSSTLKPTWQPFNTVVTDPKPAIVVKAAGKTVLPVLARTTAVSLNPRKMQQYSMCTPQSMPILAAFMHHMLIACVKNCSQNSSQYA
jgi:hypothetical protein